MEYTKERLKKTICEYLFCRTVKLDKNFPSITENENWLEELWNEIWNELDEIDEDFIPVLTELNEKGYYTNGCCSGHLEQIEKYGEWNIYIDFWYDYEFNDIPLTRSKGVYKEKYSGDKNASVEEKNKTRLNKLEELFKWSKQLPVCENKKLDYRIENGWVMFRDKKIYDVSRMKFN